jgi:DNA mismatch repair ATPase MutL
MQAYALARPAVRFRLHVLKAKNNKCDFVYAPKANANVEDAALKIVGKECALQCDWTALEMDGFGLRALLPKPTATGQKIANHGAFISVDFRPVSNTQGTLRKVVTAIRDRFRKARATDANVKDPFFCLNIICPVDSYDINIELAKDDVMFDNESFILALVDRLLVLYYPESTISAKPVEEPKSEEVVVAQLTQKPNAEEPPSRFGTPTSIHRGTSVEGPEVSSSATHSQHPRWRMSMYGIDKEDQEFLRENTPVETEEEDGWRDATISNPWTIARMNAPVKSKQPVGNGQWSDPAKSQIYTCSAPQSPTSAATPSQTRSVEPQTLQTSSQINEKNSRLDEELQRSIQRVPRYSSRDDLISGQSNSSLMDPSSALPSFEERMSPGFVLPATQLSIHDAAFPDSAASKCIQKPRKTFKNKPYVPPGTQSDDTWFGQPMRNARKTTRPHKRPQQQGLPFVSNNDTFKSQRPLVLPAAERVVDARLASENNTDIRDFFGQSRRAPLEISPSAQPRDSSPQHIIDQLRAYAEQESPARSSPCRPRSADADQGSTNTAREMDATFQLHQGPWSDPSASPLRKIRPSVVDPAPASALTPRRRQTTDGGLHRTKSSTLPLNFIPHGFEIQNVSLSIGTSVSIIMHQIHRLDMDANSLEWGYNTADAYDVFATVISERKIMDWVLKIDNLLHANYERVDGVEVRGSLHEGIQHFLDTRKENGDDQAARAVTTIDREASVSLDQSNTAHNAIGTNNLPSHGLPHSRLDSVTQTDERSSTLNAESESRRVDTGAAVEPDEYEDNFDFSQFVDLHGDAGKQISPTRNVETEDDFGDGTDDEMLMGL